MKPRKLFFLLIMAMPLLVSGQLNLSWYHGSCPTYDGKYPFDMKLDAAGNSYVCGYDAGHNAYVQKIDVAGNEVWHTAYDSISGNEEFHAIMLDNLGNLYVTGVEPHGMYSDALTCKYDTAGNLTWRRLYDGAGAREDRGDFLAMQASGDILVCGNSWTPTNNVDVMVISYDPNGNQNWISFRNIFASTGDYVRGIVVDNSNNVYAATGGGGICSFDATGNFRWAHMASITTAEDFCGDANGNTYMCGFSSSGATLHKYDQNGNHQWDTIYSPSSNTLFYAVCLDENNNVYAAGKINNRPYVLSLDPVKNVRWSYTDMSSNNSQALEIASRGRVVAFCGDYSSSLQGYTGALDTSGLFIGNHHYLNSSAQWSRNYVVAIDAWGNLRVAGQQLFSSACTEIMVLKYMTEPQGMQAITETGAISIFPNPSTGSFTIHLPENEMNAMLIISDVTGRTVQSRKLNSNETSIRIDVAPGTYFASFFFESGQTQSSKLIIH